MAIDFFCPAKVYGAEKIALKNPFISAEFDRILKHMESNWVLCPVAQDVADLQVQSLKKTIFVKESWLPGTLQHLILHTRLSGTQY